MWVGRHVPKRLVQRARTALGIVELGSWMTEKGYAPRVLRTDFDLFAYLANRVTGSAVLYLEFGVFEGRSIRWWSEHISSPSARFVGFDSFEGLPEDWTGDYTKGAFATSGPPMISDPRVSFEIGLFDKTLEGYSPPQHDQLVINIDCDLYSAARCALEGIAKWLRPGTLIYFDEFAHPDHEQLALRQFIATSGVNLVPLAYAGAGAHWVFEVTSVPES